MSQGIRDQRTGSLLKRLYLVLIRSVSVPRSWLGAVLRRRRLEREMEVELADHLERLTDDLMRSGLPAAEAARQARIELGSPVVHKDAMRSSLGLRLWDEFTADVHYGARRLRRSPGFTAVAVVSLALAIGANTDIFSMAKQVLYGRVVVPDPQNLRVLSWAGVLSRVPIHNYWGNFVHLPGGQTAISSFSYPAYRQLRAGNHSLEDLFAFKGGGMNATIAGNAQQVRTEMVSGNYYGALGIQPVLGRGIVPADDVVPGQGAVVVIGYGLWQRQFGSSPMVIGQTIKVNSNILTIIGVNPKGFTGTTGTLVLPDLVVPLSMQPLVSPAGVHGSLLDDPNTWWLNVMGRAKENVSDAAAQSTLNGQLAAIVRGTMTVKAGEDLPRMDLRDGSRGILSRREQEIAPMAVLLTMVGFVLLLACANIANLMLARGSERHREMSVRLALGAGRARIARQMLVESLLLAGLGGMGGLMIGYLGSNLLPKLTENAWEKTEFSIHFDPVVFGFTAAVTLLTGVLFGIAPALVAARSRVGAGLKESSQSVTRRRRGLGGKSLVGFQIALSTLLVIGAGLFVHTLAALKSVDVGFRTDHLLLMEINPPEKWYPAGKDIALHQRIEEAFAGVPGVQAVTLGGPLLANMGFGTDFRTESEVHTTSKEVGEAYVIAGNRFFSTMEIPILAGRSFGPQDTATSAKVGIINASLARKRFPNQNPVGKRFTMASYDEKSTVPDNDWVQIVGVCADAHYSDLRGDAPPQFFLPYVQRTGVGGMTYEVRSSLGVDVLLPELRRVVQRIDPDLPIVAVRTQEQQIEQDTQQERIMVTLTSGFGVLALVLAAVGIYGVMAYSVANRTNEIGIRLALGAQQRQVLMMVLREAAWMSLAGIVVGLGAAWGLGRLVKSMLYGLQANDPLTLGMGATLLLLVGIAASWLPAYRAASIEPMEALRCE
jgi:predicted permease